MTRRDWLLASVAPLTAPALFRSQERCRDRPDGPARCRRWSRGAGRARSRPSTSPRPTSHASRRSTPTCTPTSPWQRLRRARRLEPRSALEARRAGPLHGVPIAHKDLFETAGIRTTGGSRLYETPRAHAGRHARGPTVGGRRDHAGQDQHARTRRRRDDNQSVLRHHSESSRPDAHPGWFERRLSRGRCRAPRGGGDRQRHRRQHPDSGGAVRLRRLQAVLRPAQHGRRAGRVADVRSRRLPHPHGGGL